MSSVGKFLINKFNNVKMDMFIGLENEWLNYSDGDVQAYTIITGYPIEYDEESGVLSIKNDENQVFYISEDTITIFWKNESSFKLIENTSSTMRTGKGWIKKANRDIM